MEINKNLESTNSNEINENNNESKEVKVEEKETKKPSLSTMLIGWITLWIAISIDPFIGGIVTLVVSALVIYLRRKRLIKYDIISFAVVIILSILAIVTKESTLPVVLGYGIFGLMWLISCFTKEPLCAAYIKYTLKNKSLANHPIFLKTNRIIALGWGIVYILIAISSWFLLKQDNVLLTQIINNGATILMGVFTKWFKKWYPAHLSKKNQ